MLLLERDAPFRSGQVLGLTTGASIPPRLYSISSGESDEAWEILYTVEAEGLFSPRLAALEEGDLLCVTGPSGDFCPTEGPQVWVAGGTGIAPFLSAARSGHASASTMLIHAASSPELLYGATIFEEVFGERYLRCSSRAQAGDAGIFRGRVGSLIASCPDLPLDRPWFLCGPAEFVVDTRDLLISLGLPYPLVRAEVYF